MAGSALAFDTASAAAWDTASAGAFDTALTSVPVAASTLHWHRDAATSAAFDTAFAGAFDTALTSAGLPSAKAHLWHSQHEAMTAVQTHDVPPVRQPFFAENPNWSNCRGACCTCRQRRFHPLLTLLWRRCELDSPSTHVFSILWRTLS